MSGVPIVAVKIEHYCFNHSERAPDAEAASVSSHNVSFYLGPRQASHSELISSVNYATSQEGGAQSSMSIGLIKSRTFSGYAPSWNGRTLRRPTSRRNTMPIFSPIPENGQPSSSMTSSERFRNCASIEERIVRTNEDLYRILPSCYRRSWASLDPINRRTAEVRNLPPITLILYIYSELDDDDMFGYCEDLIE